MQPDTPKDPSLSFLEQRFPRIASEIVARWGTASFEPYANNLILNERNERQGFPGEVLTELLFLYRLDMIINNFDPNDDAFLAFPSALARPSTER